jgi:membrane-bound lytic murein transglycosylase D
MISRATLSLIVLITLCACSHVVTTTPSSVDVPPETSKPPFQVIEPSIDVDISQQSPMEIQPAPAIEKPLPPTYGIDFEFNYRIQQWIDRLSRSNQKYFRTTLTRFDKVRPRMEEIFRDQGLPTDLVYLSLVESGGNPNAISYAGATGYWQFMSGTARRYGLRINTWIDERRDLDKSTTAAARYLKHLHSLFDDWLLASAAYNAGEGTILRIKKRNPDIECFWDISQGMPIKRETLAYVPKFTATLIMARNREKYGLPIPDSLESSKPGHETITISTFTYLDEIAEVIGVSQDHLARMNPELIRGCTPPMAKQYELKIPAGTADMIAEYLSSINQPHIEYVTHTISKGDSLSVLARKYSSRTKTIAKTNRMSPTDILTIGKVLVIPRNTVSDKPRGKHTYVVARGDTIKSISLTKEVSVQDIVAVNNIEDPELIYPNMVLNIPPKPRGTSHKRHTQYLVKKGDTIWGISKQFAVSSNDVMRWNQLSSTAQIYPGDEITIYHR